MRLLLPLVVLSLLSLHSIASAADEPPRPNIVVVLIADLRWDELSSAGHPVVQTPHIDRVGREGAKFENVFGATPLCSPNRASLLTGQFAHTHGIIDNTERGPRSHEMQTFPRTLQAQGFETAFIGKWHMGNDDTPRPGFDYWLSMAGHGHTTDPVLNENGRRAEVPGYITDIFTERAVAFIERPREQPFVLYLAHKALNPDLVQFADGSISDPDALEFNPAPRHRHLYTDAEVPRRRNVHDDLTDQPALSRARPGLPPLGPDTGPSDDVMRDRWRMLAAVDESVGRIAAALEQQDLLDNTVLVVTSDHGHFAGEHGLGVERRLAYEESARTVLMVRYPPLVKPGTVRDELISSVDLAPTMLELAGATEQHGAVLHGRSLLPLLRGESPAWRNALLIEYFSDSVFPRVADMGYQAIRTRQHKYIHYTELEGMDELYDLAADPYEMHNLLYATPQDDAVSQLHQQLRADLARLLKSDEQTLNQGSAR